MAIVRQKLSGSTNGRGVAILTSAAVTIHSSTTAASTSDEAHVWFTNQNAATAGLTFYVGDVAGSDASFVTLPPQSGLVLLVPGLFLSSGKVVAAAASVTGVVAFGFVNRLTTGA